MASSAGTRADAAMLVPNRYRTKRARAATQTAPTGDPSVLRPSISVNVTGMKQAVQALNNGTPELQSYLLQECNVIYECRCCLNLFRSLGNFTAHKRSFCTAKLKDVKHVYRRDPGEVVYVQESPPPAATAAQKIPGPDEEPEGREREDENEENQAPSTSSGNGSGADQNARPRKKKSPLMEIKTTTTAFVQQEEVVDTMGTALDENVPLNLEDYSESLEVLREGGHLEEIETRPLVTSLFDRQRQRLSGLVDRLKKRQMMGPEYDYYESPTIRCERIKQTDNAYFQNINHDGSGMTIGEQYQDLQRLRSKPCCFVGPDGQVIEPGPVPSRATNLFAGDKENGQVGPLVYLCNEGECTKSFDNMKSISRHLARAHKMNPERANRAKRKIKKQATAILQSRNQHQELMQGNCSILTFCRSCSKAFSKGSVANLKTHKLFCGGPSTSRSQFLEVNVPNVMNRQLIKHPKVKLERLRREVVQKALQAYKASVYQQQWNNRKGAEQANQENGNDEDDDDDGESSGVIVVDRAEESDSVVKRVMIEPDLALQDEIQLGSAGGIGGSSSSSGGAVARVEPMDDRHSASSEDDEVVFVKRTKAGLSSPPTSGEGSGGDARKKSRKDRGLKPKRVDASRLLQAVETESEETEEEEEEEEEEASPLSIGKKRSLKNGDSQSLVKVGLKKDVGWSSSVKPDNFNQSEIVPTLLIKKIDDFENINCSGAPTNGKKDKNISSSSRSRSSSVSAVSSSYSNLSSKSNSNASSPGTNGYNDTSGQKNPRKRLALSPGAASNSSSSSSSGHNHQHTHESNASKAFKKKR